MEQTNVAMQNRTISLQPISDRNGFAVVTQNESGFVIEGIRWWPKHCRSVVLGFRCICVLLRLRFVAFAFRCICVPLLLPYMYIV